MDWDDDDFDSRRQPRRGGGRVRGSDITQALREAQQLQQDGPDRRGHRHLRGALSTPALIAPMSTTSSAGSTRRPTAGRTPPLSSSCCWTTPNMRSPASTRSASAPARSGNCEDAARYFDEAVDRVNLDALAHDESDQLLQLCQEAAEAHRDMSDNEGAETIYSALLGFLRSQGWQDQVGEVERMMRETLGAAAPPPAPQRAGVAPRAATSRSAAAHGPRPCSNGPRPWCDVWRSDGRDGLRRVGLAGHGYAGAASNGAPSEQRGDHLAQLINNLSGGTAQCAPAWTLPEPAARAGGAGRARDRELRRAWPARPPPSKSACG